jgi:hypothetical protein
MSAGHAPPPPSQRRVFSPPATRLGWWSLGLVGAQMLFMVAVATTEILTLYFRQRASGAQGPCSPRAARIARDGSARAGGRSEPRSDTRGSWVRGGVPGGVPGGVGCSGGSGPSPEIRPGRILRPSLYGVL